MQQPQVKRLDEVHKLECRTHHALRETFPYKLRSL